MRTSSIALLALLVLLTMPHLAAAEVGSVAPHGEALMTGADAPEPVADCLQCHTCPGDPSRSEVSAEGVSTLRIDFAIFMCISHNICWGCNPDEEEDADAELALSELIESEGEGVVEWMVEYRSDFALTLVGSTLQISRECGQAITWLALGDSDVISVTELLEQ